MNYTKFIVETAKELLAIDSPSGYTSAAAAYCMQSLIHMGYTPFQTVKGGVIVDLGGEDIENAVLLEAHIDTLGGIVAEVKENGRLRISPIGGMNPSNGETENVRIYTYSNSIFEGTLQLENASIHVNHDFSKIERTWDTVEVVIDEPVESREQTQSLGIGAGNFVCFEPRTIVTKSGYIKSRFLDDKLSAAIIMGYAKYLNDEPTHPHRKTYVHFTVYEEVGHGGAASVPEGVTEIISVDMGCVGKGLTCTERQVSICAKDSKGPYNWDLVSELIQKAKLNRIDYAVDVYPFYGSDVETTLSAGYDACHGLIGPGVYASHGYERSHIDGIRNTFELLKAHLDRIG